MLLFGEEISHHARGGSCFALRARTGMVFQEGALFDSLTVRDNVGYQLIQEKKLTDEEIDAKVHEALRFVGLEETFSLFPASLSGGMRRRVAIARALINQPELLLYDSPTGGLDPVTSTNIISLIVKQRDVHRTPSLLVTHRLQDAFTMCTHRFDAEKDEMVPLPKGETDPNTTFLMLEEGKLIFDGIAARAAAQRQSVCEGVSGVERAAWVSEIRSSHKLRVPLVSILRPGKARTSNFSFSHEGIASTMPKKNSEFGDEMPWVRDFAPLGRAHSFIALSQGSAPPWAIINSSLQDEGRREHPASQSCAPMCAPGTPTVLDFRVLRGMRLLARAISRGIHDHPSFRIAIAIFPPQIHRRPRAPRAVLSRSAFARAAPPPPTASPWASSAGA